VSEVEEMVRRILVERFPLAGPLPVDSLNMQNVADWDSMAHVEIVVQLEKVFDVEANANLVEAQSFDGLVKAIKALRIGSDQQPHAS
jgi:acyl carrier protein